MVSSEHSYFSVVKQGSKVFLPAVHVEKENTKNIKKQHNRENSERINFVSSNESTDEFHDALTELPSDTNNAQSDGMCDTHVQEAEKHNDDISASNMYGKFCVIY